MSHSLPCQRLHLPRLALARAAIYRLVLKQRIATPCRTSLCCSAVGQELTDWVAQSEILTESLSFDTFDGAVS